MRRGILLFITITLTACTVMPTPPAPTPTPQLISLSALRFAEPADARQLRALDTLIRAEAATWYHEPYRVGGNFIYAKWNIAPYCRQGQPGCREIELATLHYELPEAFGVQLSASQTPLNGGWSAQVYWSSRGRTVVGEGYGLRFVQYDQNSTPAAERVILPLGGTQSLFDDSTSTSLYGLRFDPPVGVTPTVAPLDDLAAYYASPEQFRTQALTQLDALEQAVNAALDQGQVSACDAGPSRGNLPPECIARPTTPQDIANVRASANAQIAERRALIEQDYRALHTALVAILPPDKLLASLRWNTPHHEGTKRTKEHKEGSKRLCSWCPWCLRGARGYSRLELFLHAARQVHDDERIYYAQDNSPHISAWLAGCANATYNELWPCHANGCFR